MATVKNIKELEKYINSEQGQKGLITSANIKRILIKEAKRLESYLKEELEKYFSSYTPSESGYERTGNTVKSIRVTDPKKLNGNQWGIYIEFDESLANHPSVWENQPDGYTPWLLEVGWDIESKVGYSAPMFTKHPGTKYITKAVERFNKSNPHGLKINILRNGKKI